MWAIVPCKRLGLAKRRLAPALSEGECRLLVRNMASDVLAVLARSSGIDGILVVSGDPAIAELAGDFGARCLDEQTDEGFSSACAVATVHLAGRGAVGIMVVPVDLPLLRHEDIELVVDAMRETPAVVLSPDRNDSGTNLMAMKPAGVIPYLFGENSFSLHLSAARNRGVEPAITRTETLALDIDTREDLIAFARTPSMTRTFRYLAETGIRDRLLEGGECDLPLTGSGRR
ncbi:MAG: 2-phospho-L-lactate guanylyltransferase [Gammaproteobacteria bacterium]|nr:2-phospho-L-lactate guanylyltransferase [Gammaproteobacteria bacterium]